MLAQNYHKSDSKIINKEKKNLASSNKAALFSLCIWVLIKVDWLPFDTTEGRQVILGIPRQINDYSYKLVIYFYIKQTNKPQSA